MPSILSTSIPSSRYVSGTLAVICLTFQLGCESAGIGSDRETPRAARMNPADFFSRVQLSAAATAFRHWEEHSRDEAFTYVVDPYDRRLPPRFRQRLQAELPEFISKEEGQHRTFAFVRVVFPEGNWVYVTYREGDPYHAIEYTDVLRWEEEEWTLVDHFVVAEGLMDTVMIDFQWPMYRETHLNRSERSDESPAESDS